MVPAVPESATIIPAIPTEASVGDILGFRFDATGEDGGMLFVIAGQNEVAPNEMVVGQVGSEPPPEGTVFEGSHILAICAPGSEDLVFQPELPAYGVFCATGTMPQDCVYPAAVVNVTDA